ncbi:PREDICTED: cubilin-like [Polistes canadensis]|uniref:cubilin-like n=1 Tax=Polistes canadensis TaxID=91411 RepID=UPI000718BA12|nr:PREDICTED: cubilin-like [Polistes canadensis]
MASMEILFSILLYLGLTFAWMDERPVLEAQDGNLIISSAKDRNITLKVLGSGYINVNEINLLHVALAAQNATRLFERLRAGYLVQVEDNLVRLINLVEGPTGLQRRIAMLEGTGGNSSRLPSKQWDDNFTRNGIRRTNERLRRLEETVQNIEKKLKENACQSNPCGNGGICQDLYEGYQCRCLPSWEGPNCMTDVNECARFLGTDLGCQNGATCINLPGSYRCDCQTGWYGLHCTKRVAICSRQNSEELCGHGVCVPKPGNLLGYTCLCDQGWETDGTNPACTKDVDECAAKHPPCSVNPLVMCFNAPGTFFCGACPRGYTGNGYYCTDIDECLEDNGGCSNAPRVQCINTMGSRVCGPCPPGYHGDGVSCIYVGSCRINNGGCHPLAACIENPALTSSYVQCRCPTGYQGDGLGPNGCRPATEISNNSCANRPCVHGTCISTYEGFICRCDTGYTGTTCNTQIDLCAPNPCKNNGVCIVSNGAVTCDCPNSYTGTRCETQRQTCGGVSRNPVGHLEFPIGGTTYQHGLSCAWVLVTNSTQVLNVTFTSFNLENSVDCKFDFLQIHDGRNAGSHMIGRFCGNTLPNKNGNIISSHNSLYFWFHSDSSVAHDGFVLHWNTIQPICGRYFEEDYGTITSPGYPGRYPSNRDCYWHISVKEGKRIQLHFGQLMLEEHATCEYDFVLITTNNDEILGRYCNHSRPGPLTAPGNEVTLYFHSDSSGQDAGFQIHYSTVEGIPGCGGVFTSDTGSIHSPGSLSSYRANMNCEWKIQLPPSEKMKITWQKFNLEDSTSCHFDAVEIYDGDSTDSPLIGRYCGDNMPPTIKSNSNNVIIVFTSDWSFEMEGFALTYEVLCGGEFTELTGVITSPLYPNTYHASKTCIYEIILPPGKAIVLTILDLDIEGMSTDCYFDSLQIFDGDNENSTNLATLCGTLIPSEPFYSTHNFMYLQFTSDTTIHGHGFKANYTSIDRKCGGFYRSSTGIIQSPNEDGMYENNEECTWIIQAPPGYLVQLTWLLFELEYQTRCRNDYVSIYENISKSQDGHMGTYCGNNKPPILTTRDRTMVIYFETDSSITQNGFMANYVFVDASKFCGGYYLQQSGVIRSPNYPGNYPRSRECVWVLEAPNRHKVTLKFNDFELEGHHNCMFDYLEIRNGGYDSSPLIGRYCGIETPNQIVSQTNKLFLKFVSDDSNTDTGFSIDWDNTAEGCGGILKSAKGDIVSPNYPQPYGHNAECIWRIVVAAGSTVQLIVVDFDLEHHTKCRYDFVEISEGTTRTRNVQRYCSVYPQIINTTSNIVTIRFRSDFTISSRGFHIQYDTKCHNTLNGFRGVIESPNFPNEYENSKNCSWIINAPIGNKINLTFSHFDVEGPMKNNSCNYDYLEIKEGMNNLANSELGKFCGSANLPPKIHSSQNQIFINFFTDLYATHNGFRLEWMVDGCGGHLTKPSDTFTSPGYPLGYKSKLRCEWLIEVDYTHSVELTLLDVNIENQVTCTFKSLKIYGGEDENAPKLVELCYSNKPVVYTSSGNKLFITFNTNSFFVLRGFKASYKSIPLQCGGRFTVNSGVIHTTNYPLNYPHNQNCEWLLQVDKNHVVNVTFEDFDIEDSRNCTDDYVKIFDGPSRDSYLMGTHCRNQLPPSYVSTSNEMLIVMRSDSIISAKGFKATYKTACGARIIIKDQGFITGSSDNMETSVVNCTWILIAENPADHVTLTFTHLHINPMRLIGIADNYLIDPGCKLEYVQVIEGEDMDGPVLGKWCNNKIPPPITSTGSALTVHLYTSIKFHSDFSATYSVLNSACGGNYTSEHGTIASPNYPNSYPLNSECIWILNTSPGNRISITFNVFNIQQSDNCDLDYLEIREENGIGKLLGVFCGEEIDPITSSSILWIKFKSDAESAAQGFLADYSFLPGNELYGPTGRITSPLYPLFYKNAGTFWWRITVEVGYVIQFEFKEVYMQNVISSCSSSLKIYDGYNDEATILLEHCSYTTPASLYTSSNIAYIVMEAFSILSGDKFDLNWLQIPKDVIEEQELKKIKLSKCTEEVALMSNTNNSYSFWSPGWPNGYEDNLECTWIFTSPPGTHLVIRINMINLEESTDCVYDYVAIYSGYALTSEENSVLEQKLCLSNATWNTIKTKNVMTVKFVSDSYLNKTGFSARVYRECGGDLSGPNGIIEINNKTNVRGIRSWRFSCEWFVTVRPGKTIEVKIDYLSKIETTNNACDVNYLMLKNGGDISSPLLGDGKYCTEISSTSTQLETIGNKLYIRAVGVGTNLMFKLQYSEKGMNCGGEYVLSAEIEELEISSPNYPNIPHPYTECVWKIMATDGERIAIHFLERFDLASSINCEKEYVEIRDGGMDNSLSMGRFCRDMAPSTMTTKGNMMYIKFYTDIPEPNNGFKALITVGDACGGILRGTQGSLSSPGYPNSYPKNQNCGWWIIGPVDHTLKIQFRDLHLPTRRNCKSADYVEITEQVPGNETAFETIGIFCGTQLPNIIETTYNEAFVTLFSDNRDYIPFRGFSLNFTSSQQVCGGVLTALTGIIKTPGYPNLRTRSRYCDWRIRLPLGFQVVVDILDLDSVDKSFRASYSLSFYNDFRMKSRIKTLMSNTDVPQIRSSGNTMLIGYWAPVGYRGFKLRYSAVAPAPCGGILTNSGGEIKAPSAPYNTTSYLCEWMIKPPDLIINSANETGLTLTLKATGYIGKCYTYNSITLLGIGKICGNLTKPKYLRSPLIENKLTILNSSATSSRQMNFNLMYQWTPCGGILRGPSHTITQPKNWTNSHPISCAWHVKYADNGEMINLTFTKLNLVKRCETVYIIVRNGGPTSPEVGTFCGDIKPSDILSTSNELWIEYYAEEPGSSEFEINLQLASHGCGGALRGFSKEIASPKFPKQYPNNAECTWEIMAENGFHIGLIFVDRFNLETSNNCDKDYVQVLDWKLKYNNIHGNWTELGKVCGRNIPKTFNSTSNRMKVIFRSNEAIQGDGFRALWNENCGGVFRVTEERKIISSPGYPKYYRRDLNCNYTLIADDDKDIIVQFLDFDLEQTSNQRGCRFDNLTIIRDDAIYFDSEESVWCGNNSPGLQRSISRMEIIFKTDSYIQRNGFQFEYQTSNCGGIITKPTEIKPLMYQDKYFGRMNCTWVIKAPKDKSVIIRFEKFVLEYNNECYFDYVAVYESDIIDSEKLMGKVCGNLTNNLPVFKTDSDNMVVNFMSDYTSHHEGFAGKIIFGSSPAAGCGGIVNLTSITSMNFRTQKGATYNSLEDCHWTVFTGEGKNIKLTITSVDIKTNSRNYTVSTPCPDDYLEVHDGGGQFTELLNKICGTLPPSVILSSSNKLWIRFFSDGTNEGSGVIGTLEAVDSPCGLTYRMVENNKNYITSPGYPNPYGPGIHCRWKLKNDKEYNNVMRVRLLEFNMTNSENCNEEYLAIVDSESQTYIDHGFGEEFIFSGTIKYPIDVETGSRYPTSLYKFCGEEKPFDIYSESDSFNIYFKTSSQGKGFKLEYSLSNCDQNYTASETQGRIFHQGLINCWITITTLPNRTISLYFNNFRLYDDEKCTHNALQIREGDFSGNVLAILCGMTTPNPIFSIGNKLSLRSWVQEANAYDGYDITYVTTEAGRGCGGTIFNYGGSFTSPMYPDIYRNNTVCTWDVSVPRGFKIILKFTFFDIGTKQTCERNNVKIYDYVKDGVNTLRNVYCGGDEPARFETEGNRIIVEYTSTVNNIGTGWIAFFMAQSTSHPVEINER